MLTRTRIAALLVAGLVPFAAAAQTSEKTAGQTVVLPSLGGKNPEIKIAGQDIAGAEATGPEIAYTAQIVQWEEGRSVTVRLGDGTTRVVPVANNVIFPPDLRPGGMVTFLVRQTSDGRYRVTGMTTGGGGAAPAPPAPPPAAPVAPPVAGAPAPGAGAPTELTPPPSPPKGKAVVGAAYLNVDGTVTAYEKGKSITIKRRNGQIRTVPILEGAPAPEDLAVGDNVRLRVPLKKPADGKSTDKIDRVKPAGTPIPSKFQAAESPKS